MSRSTSTPSSPSIAATTKRRRRPRVFSTPRSCRAAPPARRATGRRGPDPVTETTHHRRTDDAGAGAVQAPEPRGARRARRRGAAGAGGDVADQRQRGDPDQRRRGGQRAVRQRGGDRGGPAADPDRPDQLGGPDMTDQTPQEYRALTREELESLAGEPLPERAAMSLVNANGAAPINAAIALNALSDGSVAVANAQQDVDITQTN